MIRLSPIRLIDENNKQVGVIETAEAMRRAREAGLDLVEIKADDRPPICKIMDYGKYKYDLSKKEQRSRAASKGSELKEIRLGRSIKIDPHDVKIRVNQARKFLMEGHKVLIVQRFRGREMMHRHLGTERLSEIVKMLADISKVETPPKQAGRQMTLILSPDKPRIESLKAKLAQEKKAAEEAKQSPDDQAPTNEPDEETTPDAVAEPTEETTPDTVAESS
jgi:translation initiation factor IF-3